MSQQKNWHVESEMPVSRMLHIKMIKTWTQVIKKGESGELATGYINKEAIDSLRVDNAVSAEEEGQTE